jgi:uncharacterized protein (DUF1330 family)
MTCFAIGHLRSITMGPDIARYLRHIDASLEPYAGRFVVHGSAVEILEGPWPGDLIVIEFPDRDHARSWYTSPGYQQIVRLRTDNSDGSVILVDSVTEPHRATDVLRDQKPFREEGRRQHGS